MLWYDQDLGGAWWRELLATVGILVFWGTLFWTVLRSPRAQGGDDKNAVRTAGRSVCSWRHRRSRR